MREIGRLVALLHDGGMVHGDLTTSNMMLRESDGSLVRLVFPFCRSLSTSACAAL